MRALEGGIRGFTRRVGAAAIALVALLAPWAAAAGPADGELDLSNASIEDLLEIEVTSVSKRAQKLSHTPAAVTVLTAEDIRRSGATSIPEALRMVPGLHVAHIDANTWAITSRGFNSQFANKLLVMIDGRSVYTPLFSGVYWDVQDVMLEDIDRIEVIRGPGGTVWGANAVNGVINIITRHAEETQGLLTSAYGGSHEFGSGGRFGGALGDDAFYRLFVKYDDRAKFDDAPGVDANDDWSSVRGGLRIDWNVGTDDRLTLQGDYYDGDTDGRSLDGSLDESEISGGNVLMRWTHAFSESSDASVQAYYDRTERHGELLGEDRDTVDVELRHRFQLLGRNDVVWGAGYRMTSDEIASTPIVGITPSERTDHLFSLFVQDEISLIDRVLSLTVGSKLEHNDYTGFEVQPSARALWTPHERHTLWASVSRAVRAPSRAEDDIALLVPTAPGLFSLLEGNAGFDSENLLAFEAGYRSMPIDAVELDVAAYFNDYDDLRSLEPGAPVPGPGPAFTVPVAAANRVDAEGYGVELSAAWEATDFWRLTAGYTLMKLDVDLDPDSIDPFAEGQEHDTPSHQVFLLSRLSLPRGFELDGNLFFVDDVSNQGVQDYVRFDARLGWRPTERIELSVVGQNLADRRHAEFGPSYTRLPTQVPRSVYGRVSLRY